MRIKNKKSKKILLTICIAVVILIRVGLFFVSRYLVNYAIGRSGDGGDRQVSLDVEEPTDGVEQKGTGREDVLKRSKRSHSKCDRSARARGFESHHLRHKLVSPLYKGVFLFCEKILRKITN